MNELNGGPGRGQGRKPQRFTIKIGDAFFLGRNDKDGNGVLPGEFWRVSEITRNHIIFASDNGDRVRLLR